MINPLITPLPGVITRDPTVITVITYTSVVIRVLRGFPMARDSPPAGRIPGRDTNAIIPLMPSSSLASIIAIPMGLFLAKTIL